MMTEEPLDAWLASAFREQPGWIIKERQPVSSFQQKMERILLEWPETGAGAEVFVRVYRGYMSWWTLATPDLPQRELAACQIAWRGGVPVPRTLYAFQSADIAAAVLTREPGNARWKPDSQGILAHLADILARLHQAPILDSDRDHLPDVSLPALFPRLAAWAEEAGSASLRQAVDAMIERFASVKERPPGLVHSDCHLGNILADGQKITAIIDWEEAALGDPRVDVANIHGNVQAHSAVLADYFLDRYQERASYDLGPLEIWLDLTELRTRIMSEWVKHSLAQNRPLPTTNPEIWIV